MPMPSPQQDFITRVSNQSAVFLEMRNLLDQFDVLWYGDGDYDTLITQESIDSIPSFVDAGMTVSDVAEAVYSLKQVLLVIEDRKVPLTIMANLP